MVGAVGAVAETGNCSERSEEEVMNQVMRTDEQREAWAKRVQEDAEHQKHIEVARAALNEIAKEFGVALIGWEQRFGMRVAGEVVSREAWNLAERLIDRHCRFVDDNGEEVSTDG